MPVTTFLLKLLHKKDCNTYVDGNSGTGFKQTGTKMWQSLISERYSDPHTTTPLDNWISKENADVKEREKNLH